MFRWKTTLAAGIATLGMLFAAPAQSQAQSFGLNLNLGRSGISYFQSNDYVYSPYVYTPSVYAAPVYAPPVYTAAYTYPICPRPVIVESTIVVPQRYHWSPYRGWHTHGSVYAPTYSGGVVRLPY